MHALAPPAAALLASLRSRSAAMVEHLAALVSVETPSGDLPACAAGVEQVRQLAAAIMGDPGEPVVDGGRTHVRWRWPAPPGRRPIALIGHADTVWPFGTLRRWPFSVDHAAGTASGPGCFDMKAGIVQLMHAVSMLPDLGGLEILITSDEEVGSPTSQPLIEEIGRAAAAALILEPSRGGALKIGRKGTGSYRVDVAGRAAHAGLEPEKGANALIALADIIGRVGAIARPAAGTTLTPTLAAAGTAANVVPATAHVDLDVRVAEPLEADRVDRELRALATTVPGTTLTVSGRANRPPMPLTASAALFDVAQEAAADLGFSRLDGVFVGGGSDGNFTAAVGCPTLDGLGAVGAGAHAEGEHVRIDAMPERAALLAAIIGRLRSGPYGREDGPRLRGRERHLGSPAQGSM
jgi:glutamate carboxypeptidase